MALCGCSGRALVYTSVPPLQDHGSGQVYGYPDTDGVCNVRTDAMGDADRVSRNAGRNGQPRTRGLADAIADIDPSRHRDPHTDAGQPDADLHTGATDCHAGATDCHAGATDCHVGATDCYTGDDQRLEGRVL